jgi:hypothetical protein
MTKIGTYEESLPCTGALKVGVSSWMIKYYFPGLDRRHNGTIVTVHGEFIQQYIDAYLENWAEYENLKKSIPQGGDFVKVGKLGMSIRIGRSCEGVCILDYHMPIRTRNKLDQILDGYRYAIDRAKQIRALLLTL